MSTSSVACSAYWRPGAAWVAKDPRDVRAGRRDAGNAGRGASSSDWSASESSSGAKSTLDVSWWRTVLGTAPSRPLRIGDDQRDADPLLVHRRALASQAVRGPVLAVVGGEDDDRVAHHLGPARQRRHHPADVAVDLELELHVEVQERQPDGLEAGSAEWHLAEGNRARQLERVLKRRLAAGGELLGRLVVRRQRADPARRGRLGGVHAAPAPPPGDVVRVHERHRRAPRTVPAGGVVPVLELLGDPAVDAPALAGGAVGRGVGAAVETVALELRRAVAVVPVAVAVGQVPLAVPVRGVAQLAQHRPPGRKARVERADAGDHAARLVRVQTGEHRRAGRRAVVGGGVVAREADAGARQRRDVGRQGGAMGARAEPARRSQLVHHDHEDVRSVGAPVGPGFPASVRRRGIGVGERLDPQ